MSVCHKVLQEFLEIQTARVGCVPSFAGRWRSRCSPFALPEDRTRCRCHGSSSSTSISSASSPIPRSARLSVLRSFTIFDRKTICSCAISIAGPSFDLSDAASLHHQLDIADGAFRDSDWCTELVADDTDEFISLFLEAFGCSDVTDDDDPAGVFLAYSWCRWCGSARSSVLVA